VLALVIAAGFALLGFGRMVPLLLLGAVLSVVSQLGDLFESAVKRRFDVKDRAISFPVTADCWIGSTVSLQRLSLLLS
jgi:phosphatidate cytidylyltransferase